MLRASPERLLAAPRTLGLLFEYLVIRDLRVYGQPERAEVFHYRDEMGLEIDAVIERDDGAWIAVEVKLSPAREVVDRLAYAVGPECRAVIVVAESHRDEFVAVADEWNRYSEAYGRSGIRLFLVAIEVGRIGDSGPGFRFRLVAGPNEWKSATATGGRPLSEAERVRHSELREFWSGLRDVLRQRGDLAGSGSFSGQVNDVTILRKRAFSFQFLMTMESCRVELRIASAGFRRKRVDIAPLPTSAGPDMKRRRTPCTDSATPLCLTLSNSYREAPHFPQL